MDIKSKVFKRKTGKSKGKWIIRIEYFDEIKGRICYMERHADKRAEAVDERSRLVNEIRSTSGQIQTGEKMTFGDLASLYEKHFYKPAVIIEGRKVAGIRSYKTVKGHLAMLRKFFGPRRIRHITPESLTEYRLWRLEQGSRRGKQTEGVKPISLATVNRELSSLRTIMSFAYSKGWLLRELSFKKVIDSEAERERSRLLTLAEESRLLAVCQGERLIPYERTRRGRVEHITAKHSNDNPHLRAILLLALDSGLRRGEILKLRWQDLDFDNGRINVLGTHTKTERSRMAPLSQRTIDELQLIRPFSRDDRPFPFNSFAHSFATAKRLAGIDDLRFHDLRRTAITRWIQQGNPLALAGKLAGHSQLQTTQKHYVATDAEMVSETAKGMNAAHDSQNAVEIESEMVN